MKVLFLNASPRARGYTRQTLECIREHLESEEVEWVNVNDLSVKPCIGCSKCRPDGECVMPEDDGHRVARQIRNADVLIIGSPTYFGNITGPLRTLTDRSLTAFEQIAASGLEMPIPLHKGKKAVIVTACNSGEPFCNLKSQGAGALAAMEIMAAAGGYGIIDTILISGAASRNQLPDEVIAKARRIAANINE